MHRRGADAADCKRPGEPLPIAGTRPQATSGAGAGAGTAAGPGSASALRSGKWAADPGTIDPAGRRGLHAAADPAPHRIGWLVDGGVEPGVERSVPGVRGGPREPVAGVAGAIWRLRRVAAEVDGRRAAAAAGRVL